jgi:hypothetical protein
MIVKKEKNIITVEFEEKIDYKIYRQFEKIKNLDITKIDLVYVDFSYTNYITISGAIYVLYFLHYIKTVNNYCECRIINIEGKIANILAKYGFFRCAKTYSNLQLDSKLDEINERYLEFFKLDKIYSQYSIYLPIRIVPENSGSDFESYNRSFINDFIDYFNLLISKNKVRSKESPLEDLQQDFIRAVYELMKNIHEHSDSWGLSTIQSTEKTQTTLCFCDYGIGFIGSFKKRNVGYPKNVNNDKELIQWLLEDGNSSKSQTKNGHGLSRIINFTKRVNGILLIRTDKFEISYERDNENPVVKDSPYFRGAQISINFEAK